ncbi:MAG: hypothetical protein ACYDHY_07705 [Acidiferrobacterales bacterium]
MNLLDFFYPARAPARKPLAQSLYENLVRDPILLEEFTDEGSTMEHDDIAPVTEDARITQWEFSDPPNPMAAPAGPPEDDSIGFEDGENPMIAVAFDEGVPASQNHQFDTPNADQWIPPDAESPMKRESAWQKLQELPQHTDAEDIVGQIRQKAAEAASIVITFDDDHKKSQFMQNLKAKGLVMKQDFFSDVDGVNVKAKALVRLNPQTVAKDIEKLQGGVAMDGNMAPSSPSFWRKHGGM